MKRLLFLIVGVMFVSSLHAQEVKFLWGLNLSRYSIQPETYQGIDGYQYNDKSKFKTGSIVGGGIEFSLDKKLTFEIDMLYFQKGSKIESENLFLEIYTAPKEYTLNIICLPVLIRTRFLTGTSPYVLGGGEFSFIISHWYANILNGLRRDSLNITKNTAKFDYGLIIGGGFELKTKEHSFFIEGRYHLGLINISKDYRAYESMRTNTLVIIAGLKSRIKDLVNYKINKRK